MRPLSCPVPNPDPNLDASPPPAPMTPRVPPPRHHPSHLLLAESVASWHPFQKKPCLSDRSTAPPSSAHLPDAETPTAAPSGGGSGGSFRWLGPRKRRRHGAGSRSVSGRSSDRRRSGTCSDFHFTCGAGGGGGATDSSGEMWASDVGEVRMRDVPMAPEFGSAPVGAAGTGAGAVVGLVAEAAAAESGYGSEPGYRGDVELGYGDEIDEEEDDGKQQLFWGGVIGDMSKMEINDNKFGEQKSHHRCRRKKHDVRMLDSLN